MTQRTRGLTVVEMLIAAALLGLLAAVAIPQFGTPRHAAREAALLSALQTFRTATHRSREPAAPVRRTHLLRALPLLLPLLLPVLLPGLLPPSPLFIRQ